MGIERRLILRMGRGNLNRSTGSGVLVHGLASASRLLGDLARQIALR